MAFEFRYGSYRHDPGEVVVSSFIRKMQFSGRGDPMLELIVMQISGEIHADDPAGLTAKLALLEAAYALQNQTTGLFETSGAPTAHVLDPNTALGGVRSQGVSYPKGDGIEYTTLRAYTVTLEADYPITGTTLLEFQETVSFVGTGGPQWVYRPLLKGKAIRQQVRQYTTQRATQSGSALGYFNAPTPPGPLFPGNEHEEQRVITPTSPRIVKGRAVDWGMQWSYSFESDGPMTGSPHTQ